MPIALTVQLTDSRKGWCDTRNNKIGHAIDLAVKLLKNVVTFSKDLTLEFTICKWSRGVILPQYPLISFRVHKVGLSLQGIWFSCGNSFDKMVHSLGRDSVPEVFESR